MAVEVPSDFLCPISLQIMRDPVTISTGITYDRESIEKWLSSYKNRHVVVPSCPVTKLPLSELDLTPNHTLRRLIQGWCSLNAGDGVEPIPTPKGEVDRGQEVESMEFLTSVLNNNDESMIEEAIEILSNTNSPTTLLKHLLTQNPNLIQTLISIITITKSSISRAAAIAFLSSLYTISDQTHKTFTQDTLFIHLTRALSDQIATNPSLQILLHLAPHGRNRFKAVKHGAVFHLIQLLFSSSIPRECELAMATLDRLCECAEGRVELLRHGGGVAVVARKILRVSNLTNEKAVRILYNVCKNNVGNFRVFEEMVEVGAVGKLCAVVEVGGSLKMIERVKVILHLIQRAFDGSSKCVIVIPPRFDRV
ncbi:E3 ubiquitin-protein ligase PUB22, partial [Cucurbita argyrosperma subsp. argyrosperma]